ncbi:hypothetical protein DFH08DRAFT_876517 [Mycena albidolilacea]|uniref:Uncharacterized protein n=1 Tax=Mycena albidolilacea TaxID=1033008 RepID=A0AAD6ZTZ1_9AGAR|nr:hypothetical protein DFH08DRAFT_876517 [Mycena albidolilacea]
MLAFSVSSLVVLVFPAVPTVSLTNTSIPHSHTIPLQLSTWQELATSHFYIPLILLASTLGRFFGSSTVMQEPVSKKYQMEHDSQIRRERTMCWTLVLDPKLQVTARRERS